MKIATHNSGTGEKSGGWLSKLFSVFAKCQDKTLVEQYQCGVRLFDLRIRKNKKGVWVFSNGLWESKDMVYSALSLLNLEAYKTGEKAYLIVTYEGEYYNKMEYVNEVQSWDCYRYLEVVEVNISKPKWLCMARWKELRFVQCFRVLDWSSWHTLIPIPWLWAQIEDARWSVKARRCKSTEYAMIDFV